MWRHQAISYHDTVGPRHRVQREGPVEQPMKWCSAQSVVASCAIGMFLQPAMGQRPVAWQTISTLDGIPIREAGAPTASRPYLGLVLQDKKLESGDARCLVYVVRPGPVREALGLKGLDYPILFLLSVNGREIHTSDDMRKLMAAMSVGAEVRLRFLFTSPKPATVKTVDVRAASWMDWAAPIDYAGPPRVRIVPEEVVRAGAEPTQFEQFIQGQLERHGINAAAEETRKYLVRSMEYNYSPHMLSRVAYGFYRPMQLAELQVTMTDPLARMVEQHKDDAIATTRTVLVEAAKNLDVTFLPGEQVRLQINNPRQALRDVARMVRRAYSHLDRAFDKIDEAARKELASSAPGLLNLERWAERPVVRARQASMAIDYGSLLAAADAIVAWTAAGDPPKRDSGQPRVAIPAELAGAVKGDVLAVERIDGRWYIYGGFGLNEYDMTRIDVVIDPGGADLYHYPRNERPKVQLVVDWAGDDRYSGEDGAAGPASGLLGVSVVVDREGNDRYEGGACSGGAGLMGAGLILDQAGNDSYEGASWSLGAAKYGFGGIVDLGRGRDTYIAHEFSEGTGGPRGLGLLLDEAGNDLYRANALPEGHPAIFWGRSQGFGSTDFSTAFGAFDAGGIGILCDLDGHDRYEVGRFGQGMGFFYGLGLLYDRRGRDLYYGGPNSQGTSGHGGVGILADDAGDDTYQGSIALAHDASVALLIDRSGSDSYQGEFVSPAVALAENQSIAWLIDLDGQDRYNIPELKMESADASGIGQSDGNGFSYADCRCFSLSVLLDAGGTVDIYSRKDRGDGMAISTGRANPRVPQDSRLHGLFIDSKEKMTFWP